MNACTNLSTNLCAQPPTLIAFLVDTGKAKCEQVKVDDHMHAAIASITLKDIITRTDCLQKRMFFEDKMMKY